MSFILSSAASLVVLTLFLSGLGLELELLASEVLTVVREKPGQLPAEHDHMHTSVSRSLQSAHAGFCVCVFVYVYVKHEGVWLLLFLSQASPSVSEGYRRTHTRAHTHTLGHTLREDGSKGEVADRDRMSHKGTNTVRGSEMIDCQVCVCVSTGMRERPVSISLFFFNKSLYRVEVCVYRSGFVALWTLLEPWGTIAHPPHHTLPSWALSVLCVCASLSPFLCVSTSLLQLNSFAPLLFIFHSAPSGVSVPGVFQPVRG